MFLRITMTLIETMYDGWGFRSWLLQKPWRQESNSRTIRVYLCPVRFE